MELKLSEWLAKEEKSKAENYKKRAEARKVAIHKYFWNFDYCFTEEKMANIWSLAGLYPLFFKLATKEQAESITKHTSEKFLCDG